MKFRYCLLFILVGCSEDQTSEHLLEVSVSAKQEIEIGSTGNTSQMDFVSGTLTDNSFLIFNKFLRSVDTVKIGDSAARISIGAPIPFEGPDGVENINYFQEYDGSLAYIDNNSLYLPGPNQLDRLKLNEFISSKDYALLAFATINSQNKVVNTLDSENEKGFFFFWIWLQEI